MLNALTGALQQCDIFLKELHNDDPEKDGDDGNETANEETLVDGQWEDSKEE